ncbi:hypothetical protein EGR_07148 [Echinococcus granulosus]|uniref:Uncharacterized protein n=1 Tax=Echinococcus granulosus TaxID=6210 RepID=W6UBN8_ECHGR|nr:hypothetical protein EGR_07148 [Echinococcus granulosus]EUB57956.1 hypothetical protein EGR_07148 [Echinococcus granulosus]
MRYFALFLEICAQLFNNFVFTAYKLILDTETSHPHEWAEHQFENSSFLLERLHGTSVSVLGVKEGVFRFIGYREEFESDKEPTECTQKTDKTSPFRQIWWNCISSNMIECQLIELDRPLNLQWAITLIEYCDSKIKLGVWSRRCLLSREMIIFSSPLGASHPLANFSFVRHRKYELLRKKFIYAEWRHADKLRSLVIYVDHQITFYYFSGSPIYIQFTILDSTSVFTISKLAKSCHSLICFLLQCNIQKKMVFTLTRQCLYPQLGIIAAHRDFPKKERRLNCQGQLLHKHKNKEMYLCTDNMNLY